MANPLRHRPSNDTKFSDNIHNLGLERHLKWDDNYFNIVTYTSYSVI